MSVPAAALSGPEKTAASTRPPTMLRIGSRVALPVQRRALWCCALLTVLILGVGVATLTLGRLGIPLGGLLPAFAGNAEGAAGFVLTRLRGPRVVTAIGVGAALGLAGTLFQTVTRNPLGSPDVIGLGAGAGAGVALCTLLWPGVVPTSLGALAGAGLAISLVYFATGRGFSSPSRVILAGIGVAAMAAAVTQYVVSVGLRDHASQLAGYLAGTLNAVGWRDAALVVITVAIVLPAAGAIGGRLRLMECGEALAESLGGRPGHTRVLAILLSVLAAAAAVTAAGPIAFVALTAPQIARRATGGAGPNLIASALTGALIMVVADLVVQQLPAAEGLPVGVLTAGVGGLYLGFLLLREWSKGKL